MIDIIIPVYNTPINDLERCFKSILNQTYSNYIIYIIDDGSNDEIKLFLDKYCNDKNNFKVTHITNNGVSNARNVGIKISNNEYITFIDADDTIDKYFLEEAYEIITKNNLDLIIGGYNEIRNNKIAKTRLCNPGLHIYEGNSISNFKEKLISGKTNEKNKEIKDCPTGRIYTRMFKRNSINNLFDTNIHMSEDTLFMIDYTTQNKRIGIIDKAWYNYYKNDYSISSNTKKEILINNINDFINEIIKRMNNEKDINIKNSYQERINKAKTYIEQIKNS